MNNWKVEYWHPASDRASSVELFLDQLTKQEFKSVAKEIKLLEMCGNRLQLPHSKSLGDGLFEFRERNFGYRIYYTFLKDKVIVLLHAGDKSQQDKDIKLARKRLLEILEE